mmetsp:Transcript_37076/g.100019  ORF Transcript_37076/g.100019 Transcript_37076/m.100019 type:complete len:321 (-) Transcript_37076:197-1159(-)
MEQTFSSSMAMGFHESETLDEEEECTVELELAPMSLLGGFARGEELAEVRHTINCLQSRFDEAIDSGDFDEASRCREAITEAQERDPLAKYNSLRAHKLQAENRQDIAAMERTNDQMRVVKHYLPQYGLEGLWVGRSGALKKQVIRISYEDDMLVGTKIYSDNIVPSGEVIFKVKVSPEATQPQPIDVAHVTDPRLKKLERYTGKGRVVDKKSKSTHWLPGQMILVGDYFAFAWLPINLQIFFMRVPDNITAQLLTLEEDRQSLDRLMSVEAPESESSSPLTEREEVMGRMVGDEMEMEMQMEAEADAGPEAQQRELNEE